MRIIAIIQARIGSTRLPGKVLKEVLGKPLLQYQLERVKQSTKIDEIVVATTDKKRDDVIAQFCKSELVSVFRGSEKDVLKRYYDAAKVYQADVIVRLTADCPLISPEIIDRIIETYVDTSAQYVSNTVERTFPRGLDVEVFSMEVLEKVHREAALVSEREHVTKYIVSHPHQFEIVQVQHDEDLSEHRWTVDTQEDFLLMKKLLETIYPKKPNFTMEDILNTLRIYPSWQNINKHIKQRDV